MVAYRTRKDAEIAARCCGKEYYDNNVVIRATVNGKPVGWAHHLKTSEYFTSADYLSIVKARAKRSKRA